MATCNDIDASLAAVKASNDTKLAAMQSKLDGCCAKTDDALAKALQALSDVANIVKNVNGILEDIKKVTDAVAQLSSIVLPAQGLIAALLAAGAGFLLALGTLSTLGGRIDAVENGLSQLSQSTSNSIADLWAGIRNIALTPGPIGLTGDKGATGEKGDTGSRGLTGDAGLIGLTGLTGAKGDTGLTGDKGITGDRGEKGNTGDKGDKGDTGLTGLTGITGDTGRTGDTGTRGLDGLTGARGADGINGLNGTNGTNGVGIDGIDGINGLDGLIGLTGLTGNDGVQGIDGKDGLDGVDKGMDCSEMQACITPYFNDVNRRIDAVKGTQEVFVQEQAIQWVGLLPKIISIVGGISTVVGLVNELRNFFSTKIDPLTYQETYDLVDSFFPYFAGVASATDCNGNLVRQPYQGKGLIGLENALRSQFAVDNMVFLSSCNNSTQKYITANICGQTYTTGYQDDGNQAIATLLGLMATKLCTEAEDTRRIIDNPLDWKPRLEPFMKVLLDEYFPVFSGTLTGTLCNGSKINAGYSGQGLYGINSGIKAQSYIDDRVLQDLLVCISNLIQPISNPANNLISGTISGTLCNGSLVNAGYSGDGVQGLNSAIKAQSYVNDRVLQDLLVCISNLINSNNTPNYSGAFGTQDCDGKIIQNGYVQADINQVLGQLWITLDAKLNSLCPFVSGQSSHIDCEGNTITASHQGKGLQGINKGMLIYAKVTEQLIASLCKKLDVVINPNNPNNPRNITVTGSLGLTACNTTDVFSYTTTESREATANVRGALLLIGQVLDKICTKLDAIDPTKENNKSVTGTLYLAACGISKQYNYTTRKELEPYALSSGILSLMADAFNKICQKLDADPVANGNLTIDVCGKPIVGSYSGKKSDLPQLLPFMQTQMMGQALTVICEKMEEMDCDPMILEPIEKYRERIIESQAIIWFYPVGTTKSQRKTSPKWRLTLPNPKPNLTCVDFEPLTWQRGKWLSKIFFASGATETYSYFRDYDPIGKGGDASEKMLHLASLSQIPLISGVARVTDTNSVKTNLPNQPTMEVVRVIFVTFDANGQKTNVECLQCVP